MQKLRVVWLKSRYCVQSSFLNFLHHFCSWLACSTSSLFIFPLLFFYSIDIYWEGWQCCGWWRWTETSQKWSFWRSFGIGSSDVKPTVNVNRFKSKFHFKLTLVNLKNLNRHLSVLFAKFARLPHFLHQMQDGESEKSYMVGFVDKGKGPDLLFV